MKAAVIYFSLEGNTKYVADKIAKHMGADIIKIKPEKNYPTGKFSKLFWCGKSSMFKEKPKVQYSEFNPKKYDLIIFGTPIWAGNFAPPLRTFIAENKLKGKNVALFSCCSGGSSEKCFKQLEKALHDCTVISTLKLVDPFKNINPENDKKIADFATKLKTDQ